MSAGIEVKEFKHIPGVNDAEYIQKLEELREIDKGIINAAVAKIKKLSAQLKEQPEIIHCKDCDWWTKHPDSAQGRCALLGMYPTGAWYCANARKRGEEE